MREGYAVSEFGVCVVLGVGGEDSVFGTWSRRDGCVSGDGGRCGGVTRRRERWVLTRCFASALTDVLSIVADFRFVGAARCLIVEDVVTTGGSTRECIEATRIAGGDPIAACCLADRSDGTADAGVPFFSLMAISAPLWTAEDVPADVAALRR